ncbi:hypothetical protein GW17_00028369 [Ensete ventricosum]|uniref:Uncharacterized protein n=1 Tax=Ensete ventricosum TaxID=4639 RepID=A0A444ECT3_ENSVE|nr:hypothetical protein B296_00049002 [Ensete ventricosum]RWW08209.1 hypothetical protein GW17_00028369 [Ensete ventricosum]RZS26458.1 hypothetical protein BHM03_00059803 [Ensete ventricosum]
MAVRTTESIKVLSLLLLLLLLLGCDQCGATRGLNVGLPKESSALDHSKRTTTVAAASRRSTNKKLDVALLAFSMLPRGPVPPSGPIGGINGGNN